MQKSGADTSENSLHLTNKWERRANTKPVFAVGAPAFGGRRPSKSAAAALKTA